MRIDRTWFRGRLRALRKDQNDLAAALSTTASTISRILDKKRAATATEIRLLAEALEVPPATLFAYFGMEGDDAKRMPIAGFIYENGLVRGELAAGSEAAHRFRHIADVMRPSEFPVAAAFLVVETGGLPYFEAGDVLFCSAPPQGDLSAFSGRECVVTLRSGERLLRRIERIAGDRWVMVSRTGEVKADARIVEAYAVEILWHAAQPLS